MNADQSAPPGKRESRDLFVLRVREVLVHDVGPERAEVARRAVRHAVDHVPLDAEPKVVEAYIRGLPEFAEAEVRAMGLVQTGTLRWTR